eukprot:5477236-Alexandrium_andersonii.AAC.1
MSASLVGSEMCIRDRPVALSMTCFACGFSGFVLVSKNATCPILRGSKAVSYTHLTLPTICSV